MQHLTALWTMATSYVETRVRDEEGATMVEYGLLVALIALAVIGALLVIGPAIAGLFNSAATEITNSTP